MNKIIFLDIDGVLNSQPDEEVRNSWGCSDDVATHKLFGLDPELVKILKHILVETDAKIVFSSTWRLHKDHHIEGSDWRQVLADLLEIPKDSFLGNTPYINSSSGWYSGYRRERGSEIKFWLLNNPEIAQPENHTYCVIDDEVEDIVSKIDESKVIHTDYRKGLTPEQAEKAIKILNNKD